MYYKRYHPEMSEGKSEVYSQRTRHDQDRSVSGGPSLPEVKDQKERKDVKEIVFYDNRLAWPQPPVGEFQQITDNISRFAWRSDDVDKATYLLKTKEFTDVLDVLGVKYAGDGIYEKLMFHPGREKLLFEYNFAASDPYDSRCGICGERRSHKLLVEVNRTLPKTITGICFGDMRREQVMGQVPEWRLSIDPGFLVTKKDQEKADFLSAALKMKRPDAEIWKWDEYSPYDSYTFSDFVYELAAFPHASENDILLFAATRINRVLAIIPPETYNAKKNLDSGMFHPGKGYPRMSARFTMTTEKGKKRVVTLGEKKIIEGLMAMGVMRIYKGKDVFADKKPPRQVLNVWTGFQVERNILDMEDVPRVDVKPLIDFLRDWICSGDLKVFAGFMKWLVELLACPWKKVPWAVWMYTPEKRMGKGLLCDFLFHYVFGSQTMKKFNGMAEVLNVHNAWCEGKKLVVVEEASSKADDWKTGWDRLKSWAADRTISVHRKYENQYDASNLLSFMIVSNHRTSLFLEADDRRYLCINPTDSKGKTQRGVYFKDLQEKILTKAMGRAFFEFCCQTTEFDHIDPFHTDPPLNSLKEQLLEENLLPELLFASEICTMRWRVKIQANLKYVHRIIGRIENKLKEKGFEVPGVPENDEEEVPPDFDPLDLIDDDLTPPAIVEPDGKQKTGNRLVDDWFPKIDKFSMEQLKETLASNQELAKSMAEIIKKIGQPFQVIEQEEQQLAEAMNVLCLEGPMQTTDKLYLMYIKWFTQRITDGKGKSPCTKIAFGKKMAQCMKTGGRVSHVQGRSRSWNLDSILPMYISYPEFENLVLFD